MEPMYEAFPMPSRFAASAEPAEAIAKTNPELAKTEQGSSERAPSEATTDITPSDSSELGTNDPSRNQSDVSLGAPLPSKTPPPGYDGPELFKKVFISEAKGFGLVATKLIEPGEIILDEPVVFMDSCQPAGLNKAQLNQKIADNIQSLGPEFAREFLRYPSSKKSELGPFASIWDDAFIPVSIDRNMLFTVVGVNCRFINHSCIPNCQGHLSVNDVPIERVRMRMKIQALRTVFKDEEIELAYTIESYPMTLRRQILQASLGFECHCHFCMIPHPRVERLMLKLMLLERTLFGEEVVKKRPGAALQHAQKVMREMKDVNMKDYRAAEACQHCAVLAGYHSDQARAAMFLKMALENLLDIEAVGGCRLEQITGWLHQPSLMPNFGTSTRGTSGVDEVRLLVANPERFEQMLFMLGADAEEYVSLRDYHGLRSQGGNKPFGWAKEGKPSAAAGQGPLTDEELEKLMESMQVEKDELDQERKKKQTKQTKQTKKKGVKGRQGKAKKK